ncbi:MAG: metalloregulator ArsR/SmtB family transcription factor [Tissierellia bacterium]|nr:metalloregulator ArsR/SmtB family transcription factor [Tissierellia bacterium]
MENDRRDDKLMAIQAKPLDKLNAVAKMFKNLSDPTRLSILYHLSQGTKNVRALEILLGMSQSSISHQLAILREENLVRSEKRGRRVFYDLDDDHVLELLEVGLAHVSHREEEKVDD